jgi:hypothetical protein
MVTIVSSRMTKIGGDSPDLKTSVKCKNGTIFLLLLQNRCFVGCTRFKKYGEIKYK